MSIPASISASAPPSILQANGKACASINEAAQVTWTKLFQQLVEECGQEDALATVSRNLAEIEEQVAKAGGDIDPELRKDLDAHHQLIGAPPVPEPAVLSNSTGLDEKERQGKSELPGDQHTCAGSSSPRSDASDAGDTDDVGSYSGTVADKLFSEQNSRMQGPAWADHPTMLNQKKADPTLLDKAGQPDQQAVTDLNDSHSGPLVQPDLPPIKTSFDTNHINPVFSSDAPAASASPTGSVRTLPIGEQEPDVDGPGVLASQRSASNSQQKVDGGVSPRNLQQPNLTVDSAPEEFATLLDNVSSREEKLLDIRTVLQNEHRNIESQLTALKARRAQIEGIKNLASEIQSVLTVEDAKLSLEAQGVTGKFRDLTLVHTANLPDVEDLPELARCIDEIAPTLQKKLEVLKDQIKTTQVLSEGDEKGFEELKKDAAGYESKLTAIGAIKEKIEKISRDHECVTGFDRWAKNKESTLPLAFNILGLRDEVGKDGSFVEIMKNSGNGSGNHALGRAMYIRTGMAGLMDELNTGRYSRTDVSILARSLQEEKDLSRQDLLKLFENSSDEVRSPSFNVGSVAVMNLVAAGYNPKSMERDAPRLQYKVEGKGFSLAKRATYIGQGGVTVRDPVKHILPRLAVLQGMQETFRSILYSKDQPANVDPALTRKENLLEFGSMMIASMPQDFLVLNQDIVQTLKRLSEQCGVATSKFSELKERFLNVHQYVATSLETFDSTQASTYVKAADDAVLDFHRRGVCRKAAASIARGFMVSIGRPLVSLTKTVQNMWKDAAAAENFRKEMFKLKASHNGIALIAKIRDAVNGSAITPQQGSLILQFLSGNADRLDLRKCDNNYKSDGIFREIKSYAEEAWTKVNPKSSTPSDLVLLPVQNVDVSSTWPPLRSSRHTWTPPEATPEASRQDASKSTSTADTLQNSPRVGNISAPPIERTLNNVSGRDNRCWLRAANAGAVDMLGVKEVSKRVFDALEKIQHQLTLKSVVLGGLDVLLPADYKPYWPKNTSEVEQIYETLANAEGSKFEVDKDNEDKLQKMTLQVAFGLLINSDLLQTKANSDNLNGSKQSKATTELDSLIENMHDLANLKSVQGDRQIITAFLKALDLKVAIVSDSNSESQVASKLADQDQIVIKHSGPTVDEGHYDFYGK